MAVFFNSSLVVGSEFLEGSSLPFCVEKFQNIGNGKISWCILRTSQFSGILRYPAASFVEQNDNSKTH